MIGLGKANDCKRKRSNYIAISLICSTRVALSAACRKTTHVNLEFVCHAAPAMSASGLDQHPIADPLLNNLDLLAKLLSESENGESGSPGIAAKQPAAAATEVCSWSALR